jgi:hypothetical protein
MSSAGVGAGARGGLPGNDTLQFDFAPNSSSSRHLLLYDPAALPADFPCDPDVSTSEPKPPPADAVEKLAAAGSALVVHIPHGDCAALVRVFAEEDPPERLRERQTPGHAIDDALLRVPAGTLLADGAEFVQLPGGVREWATKDRAELPAGDYSLDAFHLMEWKERNRTAGIASGASALARGLDWIVNRVALARIVLVVVNLAVIPVLLLSVTSGWRSALAGLGTLLAADALLVGLFWLLSFALKRHPASRQVQQAREKFDRENPDVVVVLKRNGANASPPPARPSILRIAP